MRAASLSRRTSIAAVVVFSLVTGVSPLVHTQAKPRARALGVPFDGTPGPLNAITDVAGVEVGHATIVRGDGPLVVGKGPVRTGVTAIWPRGKVWQPVFAGWFAGNGFGEMTGAPWVVEGGVLGGPVMITGTYSVGAVRDAVNSWFQEVAKREIPWHQPVVGETSDAFLNDGLGQHVTRAHVFEALNSARGGVVPEGNVGGGTGMVAHGFKGGIGTASRRVGDEPARRARPGELRDPRTAHDRRRAGRPRDCGRRTDARRTPAGRSRRLHHCRRRY